MKRGMETQDGRDTCDAKSLVKKLFANIIPFGAFFFQLTCLGIPCMGSCVPDVTAFLIIMTPTKSSIHHSAGSPPGL